MMNRTDHSRPKWASLHIKFTQSIIRRGPGRFRPLKAPGQGPGTAGRATPGARPPGPSPQPRSRAVPGGRGAASAISCGFGSPLQILARLRYFSSHTSAALTLPVSAGWSCSVIGVLAWSWGGGVGFHIMAGDGRRRNQPLGDTRKSPHGNAVETFMVEAEAGERNGAGVNPDLGKGAGHGCRGRTAGSLEWGFVSGGPG